MPRGEDRDLLNMLLLRFAARVIHNCRNGKQEKINFRYWQRKQEIERLEAYIWIFVGADPDCVSDGRRGRSRGGENVFYINPLFRY